MAKIAIVGCGIVGRAWTISFARAGHGVALWDPDEDKPRQALDHVAGILPDLEAYDLLNGVRREDILSRIRSVDTLDQALYGAEYVQECAPEDPTVKRDTFSWLDGIAGPQTILASSSSAIPPSVFTEGLAGRDRCLVVHPINPPYLVPVVELVPAPWTDPQVVERARRFLTEAGQAPIVLARELEGFVVNRLQGALLEEAFRLVAGGHATVEDVDTAIRDGLAPRWSVIGPFETMDLNAPGGVRDYVQRYQHVYASMFSTRSGWMDWEGQVLDHIECARRQRLPLDQLGRRQAWRDHRLMALIAHGKAMREQQGD